MANPWWQLLLRRCFFLPNFLFVCLFFPFLFFPFFHHISLQTRSWKKHEHWSFSYVEKLPSFYISTTKPSPLAVLSVCESLLTSSEQMLGGGFALLSWFQFWNMEGPDTSFYSEFASVNNAVLLIKQLSGGWRDGLVTRNSTTLTEDQGSVLSSTRWLTAPYNHFSSRISNTLSGLCRHCMRMVHMQTSNHIYNETERN